MSPALVLEAVLQSAVVYAAAWGISTAQLPQTPRWRLRFWQVSLGLMLLAPISAMTLAQQPSFRMHAPTVVSAAASSVEHLALLPSARYWVFAWLFIALFRLCALSVGLVRLRELRQGSTPVRPESLPHLTARTGVTPVVLESDCIRTPASFGSRKPVILVPRGFCQLAGTMQRAALAHELVHLTRNDWLAQVSEEVLLAVLWFHPPLFAAIRQIRLYREQVTDAEAIRLTGSRQEYLRALVTLANVRSAALFAPCFSAAQQLKQRIQAIQKEPFMLRKRTSTTLIPASALLIASVALAVWAIPLQSAVATGEQIYRVGGNVKPPQLVSSKDPSYTPQAKDAKVEGTVGLELVIGRDGMPSDVSITRSLDAGLDQKAMEAVRQWRFTPATKKGKPVAVRASVEVHFKLL